MEHTIVGVLDRVASDNDITILSEREMGSRMMGVSHDDSDWDVMFVYCFDEPWKYVARGHSKKTIDTVEGDIEIHGWNIDKFVEHYMDSNPTVVEFLSADVYDEKYPIIWRELERDMTENFNHMALYHHYISLAKSNYTKYIANDNDCTRGRQFYIMRAAALARYIRVVGEMPQMDTYEFLDEAHPTALSDEEHDKLMWLADQKYLGRGDKHNPDVVGEFYQNEYDESMDVTDERVSSPSEDAVNDLVRESLKQ